MDVGLEKDILKIIAANPESTMTEMAGELNVTKRTIERTIKRLREQGKLIRRGGKRYGYWEVL